MNLRIKITVGGIPWEFLTDEHRQKIIKRNTDVASKIITNEIKRMIEKGKSINEIKQFLGLEVN